MICTAPEKIFAPAQSRPALARERARIAHELLADCHLCAHDCGVNRLAGETVLCRAGADAHFFSAQTEVSDELELMPVFSVALSGCDMRCDFCITGKESWNPRSGDALVATRGENAADLLRRRGVAATQLAEQAKSALANGAKTIMVLGGEPTIYLPAALEFVSHLPADAKLIWKTNAHGSAQARELLDGIFDVWLADFKFGNDACAERLAKTPNYVRVVRENLLWANDHSELIVRHLLMPGHVECCWRPVAEWLAENLPDVKVNLRSGFWPAWHARRHGELASQISTGENETAFGLARELGINLIQ
jgi:putative pyruvate formate lyase activating enzyme